MTAYPGQIRMTLGQLCATQSWPDVIHPGFEPGSSVASFTEMQCLRQLHHSGVHSYLHWAIFILKLMLQDNLHVMSICINL